MKAKLSAARITPKKANLIAGLVRRKSAKEALTILKYTPKKAAKMIHKLLASAIANAVTNFKQDEATLMIKEIVVNKGPTLKRGVPVSRGRIYPILKRTANIMITLEVNETAALSTKKSTKKDATAEKIATTSETSEKKPAKVKKSSKKSGDSRHVV